MSDVVQTTLQWGMLVLEKMNHISTNLSHFQAESVFAIWKSNKFLSQIMKCRCKSLSDLQVSDESYP